MNWKDLFSFNRSERNGIIVFIIILIIIILLPYVHKVFFYKENVVNPEMFKKNILAFEQQLMMLQQLDEEKEYAPDGYEYEESVFSVPEISLKPIYFNPNNLAEESWLKMGMPERIVRTIKNFEAAGGYFRFKEDLKRIYGFTDEIYNTLESYIELPSRENYKTEAGEETKAEKYIEPEAITEPLLVDINTADSIDFIKIRGIGPVFSSRIVSYRDLLGGFISVNQLLDVYGFDEERFESISEYVTINDTVIDKLNLNAVEFGDLLRHPYFDRNLVNNLIQMRDHHNGFKSLEDVKKSHLIDDKFFSLIAPYISVD